MTSDSTPTAAGGVTPAQAREIAEEAYDYGFPMLDSNRIQYEYFVDPENPEYKGMFNEILTKRLLSKLLRTQCY